MDIKKISALEIKPFFDSLNDVDLVNQELLTEFILKRIGVGFRQWDYDIQPGEFLSGGFKIKVWPDELARVLIFLHEHKDEIGSFLEFGTGSGGTFFVIDSYLRSINPKMGNSVTIDKHEHRPDGIELYEKQYPVKSLNMRIEDFEIKQNYDLCFIDATHNYQSVKEDYERVKEKCKFVIFHDILADNPKRPNQRVVRHFWQEVTARNKIEIVTDDSRIKFMSGFGIVWN